VFKRRTSFLLLPSATLALTIVRLFDEEFSAGEKSPLHSLTRPKGEEKAHACVIAWLQQLSVAVTCWPL
jgi:hypothetical protein